MRRWGVVMMVAALLMGATDARVPLRDECARAVAVEFPFIRWTHPPTDRALTLEEIGARTALRLCRWQAWRDGQRAQWAQEMGG